MKPLYLTQPVRKTLGCCLRPGGIKLTRRALELAGSELGKVILDAGCGPGGSAELLMEKADQVMGLDLDSSLLLEANKTGLSVLQADLANLPFSGCSVDTIFCECTWNLTRKVPTLAEFRRVLRTGGMLILSDLYLRTPSRCFPACSWPITSCFSQATGLETVQELIEQAGFDVKVLEDHIQFFKQTAAEFVFAYGSLQDFWSALLGDEQLAEQACLLAAKTRPSLFLLIATRLA